MSRPGVRRVTWRALRARRRELAGLGGWSLVESLPALLAGYLVARAVDEGFLAGRLLNGLAWLGVLAVAVLVGAAATGRTYRSLGAVVEPFRDEVAAQVIRGALRDATRAGGRPDSAAVTRLTHQMEIVRDTFAGLLMVTRGFLFSAGAALLGLLALAPVVALLAVAPLVAGLVVFLAALPAMVTHQRAYVRAGEQLGQSAATALAGHRDVLACGAQARVTAEVARWVSAQAAAERMLARMAAIRSLSLGIGGWLPLLVLMVTAPWLVERGLTAGAVLGALIYVSTGLQPTLHTLVQGLGGGGLRYAVTLENILRTYPVPDDQPSALAAAMPRCRPPTGPAGPPPAVEVRDLTFGYGPRARPVLQNFSLTLADRDHLAVVGPSGAGKSTLAALMAGLVPPQAGAVHLAGTRVAEVEPAVLARMRVLVPQEAYVFTGSLADNLRYLRPDADDDTLEVALDALGACPLATRLGGLGAPVAPALLSAGERQLIAAVRAWLAPAPLVVLDEATCHLDPVLEARVEAAFARRPGTLVVIAHRISSALRAGRVLVLDGDEPVVGTHEQLLARSATYRVLVGCWDDSVLPSPAASARQG
ncbi:ABC transporter ATP-binding protein [Micromonospora noduli]|uniref:Energy-coupling factor transporter ATP-binding p rotein EcfA1 n=1 Tax=Micromonospora noduli TaxID=709876 RepID=A0A328NCH7_9ACTN|nr:ABC transporter ATP-binding protein [Micromonospora noduli]RAO04448.1 Energy-coupling factor transporter ATP-binding p rotein EcfA1 [Micromonospora noduli]RAO27574.1 Energy-coupling factor transporter ATP-binding p rotein EcfA1 [Micromonospora noduli]